MFVLFCFELLKLSQFSIFQTDSESEQPRATVLPSHHMHKCIRVAVCVRVSALDHSIPLNAKLFTLQPV